MDTIPDVISAVVIFLFYSAVVMFITTAEDRILLTGVNGNFLVTYREMAVARKLSWMLRSACEGK
jgi:hypothetical protein